MSHLRTALAVLASTATIAYAKPQRLHVEGSSLMNQARTVVDLHGVDLPNHGVSATDVQSAATMGANMVRVKCTGEIIKSTDGRLRAIVKAASDANVYVILVVDRHNIIFDEVKQRMYTLAMAFKDEPTVAAIEVGEDVPSARDESGRLVDLNTDAAGIVRMVAPETMVAIHTTFASKPEATPVCLVQGVIYVGKAYKPIDVMPIVEFAEAKRGPVIILIPVSLESDQVKQTLESTRSHKVYISCGLIDFSSATGTDTLDVIKAWLKDRQGDTPPAE